MPQHAECERPLVPGCLNAMSAAMISTLSSPAWPAHRLRPEAALWLVVSVLMMFLAASSAPSPLYALYREMWGFSALSLTVIFSSYAFALLGALLCFGALSDHVGRRSVVVASLALEFVSILAFWRADSVGWLVAARLLQGLATGMATSALSALLVDLHPVRGPLMNALAPMTGMAVGALGTSLLVQYLPAPTHLVFELLLVVIALQCAAAFWLPETVARRVGAWRSLVPSMHVPQAARVPMLRILPLSTAGWALGGFYLSLGPSLGRLVTHSASPLVGGLLISALVLPGALAIAMSRHHSPRSVLQGSAVALAVGLAITLTGVAAHSTAGFFCGTLVAGLGFGAGFSASVRSLVPLASAQDRAGLMASFFVLSYLAFSLPAIAAGVLTGLYGLQPTAMGYGLLLIALASTAAFTARAVPTR